MAHVCDNKRVHFIMKLSPIFVFFLVVSVGQVVFANRSQSFLDQVKSIASKQDPYARRIALQNAVRLGNLEANQNSCSFRQTVHQLKGLTGEQRKYTIIALSMISDKWVAQLRLAELGVPVVGTKFDPNTKYPHIQNPELPQQSWSGSGMTGVSPADQPWIPLRDQYRLFKGHEETTGRYKHKVPFLEPDQAKRPTYTYDQYMDAFLNMPIVTKDPDAYCNELPSRASVIRAAACRYGIHPKYLASFLIMENSDQTVNEDKADYQGGVGYFGYGKNTSIGIGQIQINNALKGGGEIFSDLLPKILRTSRRKRIANYLSSDEYAIFAVAKYIRDTANAGADLLEAGRL